MDIRITSRNFELKDPLKRYIHKRLSKLERIYSRIYQCEVVLEENKIRGEVEVILSLKRNRLVARESSKDIYASIDAAAESIKKQLRRLRDRVRSKRRKTVLRNIMRPMARFRRGKETFQYDGRESIVKINTFADKPMLPEEAKLELQMTEKNFLMFKNADTGEPNVIFSRDDGSYGLIEPGF